MNWSEVLDRLDPPPGTHPPGWESPTAFAQHCSRGLWRPARHLTVIEQAVLDAIDNGTRVILSVSVRHGKSELCSRYLPAWYLGRWPDRRVILAGHESDFAKSHGRAARDLLTEYGPDLFGVQVSRRSEAANRWDLDGRAGGMLTVGVGGSPIGRGADLMIVDDPIKSWQDAMSPTKRAQLHEWWTGTMVSRIQPGGAVVVICARWHEDDLSGFLLREDPDNWVEVRLPARCDDPDRDPLGRAAGEPLWPEGGWDTTELERAERETSLTLGEQVWLAQYQQTPRRPEGGMFPPDRWVYVTPDETDSLPWHRDCRGWDLAATAGAGDFTVGARVHQLADGRWYISDVWRGQVHSDEMRARLLEHAHLDGPSTLIELPQDPAQAGKDQAQQLVRMLAGYPAEARPQSGTKETRAMGLSAQQRAGNVLLPREASWVPGFVSELEDFPKGRHDDQVDAVAAAFNRLAGTRPRSPIRGAGVSQLPQGPTQGRGLPRLPRVRA